MEHSECSETSAYKIQTPGNYPEENIQYMNVGWRCMREGCSGGKKFGTWEKESYKRIRNMNVVSLTQFYKG